MRADHRGFDIKAFGSNQILSGIFRGIRVPLPLPFQDPKTLMVRR
jgi:hypothetical protein